MSDKQSDTGQDEEIDANSPYPWMRSELEEDVSQPFRPWMIALALASMLIFIVAVWYAWNEGQTANDGPPPIIQADESPVKMAPDEPGGMDVPHQENEIFAAIEEGPEITTAEELLSPPEEPVAMPAAAEPLDNVPTPSSDGVEELVIEEPVQEAVVAAAPPVATPTPKPAAPAPSASKFVIQLAALRSTETATQAWKDLLAKHTRLLGQLTLDIEPVNVTGQGTFYRVRGAGFDTEAAAQQRCTELKAAGQACLVKERK